MKGCFAPSEIPSVTSQEASVFGSIAEAIIYADFFKQYGGLPGTIFQDSNNPAAYLYFLAIHNPRFTQDIQLDFYTRIRAEKLGAVPDFMVHRSSEKSFYEVKPESKSGLAAGATKVGRLSAIYKFYRLPYVAGTFFEPKDHQIAFFQGKIKATLNVTRATPGLIVYKICLEVDGNVDLVVLASLLAYIVREVNKQYKSPSFKPINLEPVFKTQQFPEFAKLLGLGIVTTTAVLAAKATWKHFWKAVVIRFAVRGSAAAALTVADGPLPIGDLLAAGLALWTIIDVVRFQDELWKEADKIAVQEA